MSASDPPVLYLLNTDIVSALSRQPAGIVARRIRAVGPAAVAMSAVTQCELEFGLRRSSSIRLQEQVRAVMGRIAVLPLGPEVAARYGEIRHALEQAGTPIGPNDLLIAAHALALGAVMVTGNFRDYSRVPGLTVENWL